MLRMSKLADYSFVLLSRMAEQPEMTWSAAALATETTLPLPTVAKLMKLLAKSEIVAAQRGAMGGYTLVFPAKEITIARIIEAVDGPITLTQCSGEVVNKGSCDCQVHGECPVRESWGRINTAIRTALQSVFLSDLVVCREEK
ncbi:MAG: SUF system Fe-S cluster assembly regulator [Proteobacteria bacterium]|nr:SUF system Fe-S cluster assembly regulator [Pseudomonadota bacterium]